jgi:hypothetical protein
MKVFVAFTWDSGKEVGAVYRYATSHLVADGWAKWNLSYRKGHDSYIVTDNQRDLITMLGDASLGYCNTYTMDSYNAIHFKEC